MAKRKKPYNPNFVKVKAWPRTTLIRRLHDCRSMLYIYDVLTEAENVKVHRRLMKRIKKFNQ